MASGRRGLFKFFRRATKTNKSEEENSYPELSDDEEEEINEELLTVKQSAGPEKNAAPKSKAAPGKNAAEMLNDPVEDPYEYLPVDPARDPSKLFIVKQNAGPEKNVTSESNAAPGKNAAELPGTVKEKDNAELLGNVEEKEEKNNAEEKDNAETTDWSFGTKVIGIKSFRGRSREELSFEKDERLVIIGVHRDPKWLRAYNYKGIGGIIPRHSVHRFEPEKPLKSWFHGSITRQQVEKILYPYDAGHFLIRNSNTHKGHYVLSVCNGYKVCHYLIWKTGTGRVKLGNSTRLPSNLHELVEYYNRFAYGLCARLTKSEEVKDEVPLEIRTRGRLALKAYKKAIFEGKTISNRVPIMLIGQDRSGKTSLVRSLKREKFNPEEDSTIGIDVDPSYFNVATEIWKLGEKDGDLNFNMAFSFEHHAARMTVQNFSEQANIHGEEDPKSKQIQEKSVELCESDDNVSIPRKPGEVISGSCLPSEGGKHPLPTASVVPYTTSHDSFTKSDTPNIPEDLTSISMSLDQTTTSADHVSSLEKVPEEVTILIEALLKEDNDVTDEEDIYSILWDFGGQSVCYTTHPLFLTSRAIYFLVNDLSRDPQGKAESVMKQGTFCKQQDSSLLKTNLDYLDFWMSSVASLAIHDERYPKECNSEMLPEKLPPVFLVCTHADKPCGGCDPSELARMAFGHLQTKSYQGHLLNFFTVDNTKSGHGSECQEVVRLREEIRAVAKELPQMKEAIPIKWLGFEKAMQAAKNGGRKWISFEDAKQIACDECHVVDDEEFRTLLNFLHDQRILIHFDDTPELNKMVVLDVQWLIDVFKEVITIRPFDSKDKKFKNLWFRLEKEGILEESLLEHVWGPLYHKEDTCQSLIAIMEKFSLLCSWPSSDSSCGKQYLVPSMLMSHPPEDILELVASAEIPPLFIKFESGQVPLGLFPRLVLHFLQWCKQECTSLEHPQLYHNFVRIYDSEEENCSVILLCHMSSIEVVAYKGDYGHEEAHCSKSSDMTSRVDNHHDTFACLVLRQVELMLESMRGEFRWLQNMKYEISFLCPVCCQGGAVSYCRTHRIKNCKQEECLHFWPESKLFSDKKMICCTRSETAKTNRVSVKNFKPWFPPMRNQASNFKCDEGKLASVEDGKETFSADEVLQICLTQQRDDPNISPQLKGSLQLEGACPDTPDFDCMSGDMLLNPDKSTATTEVSLPDNIEQSLLLASLDAKEIVHQLKENLQLDKEVLERPDPDTKKIVRSLAQKAKDLKRLDVFKYLRELAPAGTTGPLLPENLPVQNMPITKAKELTIDLAGGDEWMELAEGLGLTPQEIRFLDKRTLNPMEATLSFIAKQRYLSVGELYELLNEHGFPKLADRL